MTCVTQEFTKDPDAVLDYVWDWTLWLEDDTIASHTILPATGITVDSSNHSTTRVTAWLSGGTDGQNVEVTCRITTTAGRTADRTFLFRIRSH